MKVIAVLLSVLIGTQLNPFEEMKGRVDFANFLSHFERVEQVPEFDKFHLEELRDEYHSKINLTTNSKSRNLLRDFLYQKAIKFSRIGPPQAMPVYRFYPDEKTIATVYVANYGFDEERVDVFVQLFDLHGKQIEEAKLIAKLNPQETQTCTFLSLNEYTINNYKNVWLQPIETAGFVDNEILNYELLIKEQLQLVDTDV